MEHRRADRLGMARDGTQGEEVGGVRIASHRQSGDAQRETWREVGQGPGGALATGGGIADESDLMPGRGLNASEIEHMPEEAADRRAEHVQDALHGRAAHSGVQDWDGAARIGEAGGERTHDRELQATGRERLGRSAVA